jgi:hypothetical protein
MKPRDPLSEDQHLQKLLRGAHPSPSLPPRFQEGVWERVERGARTETLRQSWGIDAWVRSWFRPAYLAAGLALAVLGGTWLGFRHGEARSRLAEQARYIASVDPFHRVLP